MTSQFESDLHVPLEPNRKSVLPQKAASKEDNAGFDCNICLDTVHEPVVTLCGHLYCWACIYQWIHVQNTSPDSEEPPHCPVCKATISNTSVVPLYGKTAPASGSKSTMPQLGIVIPSRPVSGLSTTIATNTNTQHQDSRRSVNPVSHNGDILSFCSPIMGNFGEMVYARIFGDSETGLYTYSSMRNTSPRLRRQEMQIHRSLNRLSIFLLCGIVLCFLLF